MARSKLSPANGVLVTTPRSRSEPQQAARELKIHKTLRGRDRGARPFGDVDDYLDDRCLIGRGITGQKKVDVIGRHDAPLPGFSDLNHGQQWMSLLGVFADNRECKMRTASAETGE